MKPYFLTKSLAALLVIALVAPATFFIAPSRASAEGMSCLGGLVGGLSGGAVTTVVAVPVSNIPISTATGGTMGATTASCIYDMILIPLARAIIRQILQRLTADVINWINNTPGKNGSSAASFIRDLPQNLQAAGDAVALTFISSAATAFLSPFGAAISSVLRVNYYQQTSLAGFWGANQNTLPGSLQSQQAFLSGRWSQGGVAAWFGLTTQPQNNPYMLYPASLVKLSGLVGAGVGGATGARLAQAAWGSGFMSWCGTTDSAAQTQSSASTGYQTCVANCDTQPGGYTPACADACTATFTTAGGNIGGATAAGTKVGDACTNSDGTQGKVQTPGSTIHEYTTAFVVNSGMQQLISANDLDAALGQIVNALAAQVLGGVINGAAGLFGASQPSGGQPSITSQLNNYMPDSMLAASSSVAVAQSMLDRITVYNAAWSTIGASANNASTNVQALITFCNAAIADPTNVSNQSFITLATTQVAEAQTAFTTYIAPVIAQAQAAPRLSSTTQAFALKVESEAASSAATLSSDIQTLIGMSPTSADLINVQQNAQDSGGAKASPVGSLTVSRGSLVDQMNLISTNAATLKTTVCNPNSSLYVGPNFGGGG